MDGGAGYEQYVETYRRELQLADKCTQTQSAISLLDQFVTLFTITPTMVTPSQLAQLQSALAEKRKELNDLVVFVISNSTLINILHL